MCQGCRNLSVTFVFRGGFLVEKMDTLNKLKQFDAYPKTLEDFRVKTWGGATGERLQFIREQLAAIQTLWLLAAAANNKAN